MIERPSSFLSWFRMQAIRNDTIGGLSQVLQEDPGLAVFPTCLAIRQYLERNAPGRFLLPIFAEATADYDHYRTRQWSAMPCLLCRKLLTSLPREAVDIIWFGDEGLEAGTYGFLHKPCFVRIDQPALDVETLDRFLNTQHGYARRLPRGWVEALLRLWPAKKPGACGVEKGLSLSTRFDILKRDQYRCRLCGAAARDSDHVRLEVDHIVARYHGGTDDPSNLWTLCFACNRGKGTKDL